MRDDIAAREARLVAVDGRGGSGKSTLARALADGWPGWTVVEMDDFYRPVAERVQRADVHGANYDKARLVAGVLDPLASGRGGRYRRYDWEDDRLAEWQEISADSIVIVEGLYSTSACLRPYFDYRIWVECPYNLRLRRGIERDGETMRSQWVDIWMPAEDRYVEDERPDTHADLVLDGTGAGVGQLMFQVAPRAHGSSAEQSRRDDRDNRC